MGSLGKNIVKIIVIICTGGNASEGRHSQRLRINFSLAFCILIFSGCVTSRAVVPESLESETGNDIIVSTNSEQMIKLYAGQYRIQHADSNKSIRGTGTVIEQRGHVASVPFDGTIAFADIRQIETRDKSTWYYSGYFIFGAAAAAVLVVLAVFNGRGMGG